MNIFRKPSLSGVGIVVIAALLVEIISVVEYHRAREMMESELLSRSHMVLRANASEISHALELAEATMKENMWALGRAIEVRDSSFSSIVYLIDDNPHILGGCLAFVPGYYPGKPALFEPYGRKENGQIKLEDLAASGHDYTVNPTFRRVMETGLPEWSDPYRFGPDSINLATYSHPVFDRQNRLAAVCGVDLDLSWLGDTLNMRLPFASTYGLLLTQEGKLVTGPSEDKASPEEIQLMVDILNGRRPISDAKGTGIRSTQLKRAPFWRLAQVYRRDEVFAKMRKMRLQHFLMTLLALAILAFMILHYAHNEKKLREASAQQARLNGELTVARNIQREMLPKSFPDPIFGTVEPATAVGGDLFDFYVRDGKLFFCIGDVSGKGVPSAMLMSVIHSLFRVVSQREESPSRILSTLNEQLCRNNNSNMFVTFFVACLDLYTGSLHYANAGHDKPFLLDSSASLLPVKSNLPLGVFPGTDFVEERMVMTPGQGLFLYTDGLTEAKNPLRENFGRPRVQEVLNRCLADAQVTPELTVKALSDAAHAHAGEEPQSDDLTMLLVRFVPENVLREQLTLRSDTEDIPRLGAFVKDFCARLSLDRKLESGLRLALEETVVNVMNYAYPSGDIGNVTIYADSNYREVRFTVVDSGVPFDPTAVLSADTTLDTQNRPIGGLGIHLTRKLMDSVSYCRKQPFNVLTLTKSIV